MYSKKIRCLISWILVAATWPLHGHAAPQWCSGTVSQVWVNVRGDVFFVGSWRGDHTKACNINEAWNTVAPLTCATWFASLQTAVRRQSTVTIHYTDVPACNSLPTYESAPTPYYIMNVN